MRDARSVHARGVRRWYPAVVFAVAVLAGCMPIGGAAVVDPGVVGLGCEQSETFLFSGQTTLAALGLGEDFGGPDAQRTGMIWITADPVSMGPGGPRPAGVAEDLQRIVCVQWPDGSGMAGSLPPDWVLPSGLDLGASAAAEGDAPFVLIGLVVAAALIGGVSFLAFRGDPH